MSKCKIHYKKIQGQIEPASLTEVFAEYSGAAILGGNDSSKFSFWMAEPKEIFEFRTGETEPFEKLHKLLGQHEFVSNPNNDLPKGIFIGGWVGHFGYELGRYIEKLPARTQDDLNMPLIRLCFYDKVIVHDSEQNVWWAIALEMENDSQTANDKILWLQQLAETKNEQINVNQNAQIGRGTESNMTKREYLEAIEKIKYYLHEGEVYQINFSHRFGCDYNASPVDLYHWQNHHNPSPYSAYINAGDFAIVSASPEMFITIREGIISTKPIKGTRPRTENNRDNIRNFSELLNCEKEKAELNMIVDLERNDLGRVCQYGTIKVSQPRTIETHPTVFHAAATIEGALRSEITFCDVLKAMFPGGSITGAPKIRAMEIIDKLEPAQRGVYTGSIGFIGVDGSVSLNIAIRTVIIRDGRAYVQTGGGIVYDSRPESEWQETITKAKALLEGIEACNAKNLLKQHAV